MICYGYAKACYVDNNDDDDENIDNDDDDENHEAWLENNPVAMRPGVVDIPGWRHGMAWFDLDHTIYAGFAKDLAGSVLIRLCDYGHFGDGGLDKKLQRAYRAHKLWAKSQGIHTTLDVWERESLHYISTSHYPEMGGKMSDIKTVDGNQYGVRNAHKEERGSEGKVM
eukprot:1552936-Karenia_brevis.AAC.1